MLNKEKPWEERWTIEKPLGAGGQGTTFFVRPMQGPQLQAVLKILNAGKSVQARGRMRREVVSLETLAEAQVKVPRILDGNTEDFADPETTLYFVMEYVSGKSLAEEVTSRSRLPLDQAAKVAKALCGTMSAAHKNDVLHRDLKPDNIIVREFDEADLVIVDYGLSYLEADDHDYLTRASEQMRSRFFALPEMNTPGGDRRDKRSDVTMVAGVFYFCLTGFPPCQLRDGNNRPPHRRQGFSVRDALGTDERCEQVEGLFDQAFAVEVENRYQSCEELLERLDSALKPLVPDEDPALVSSQLAKLFRQHDRRTLLHEFGIVTQKVLQRLMQECSQACGAVAAPFAAHISGGILTHHPSSFPVGIDPLGGEGFTL